MNQENDIFYCLYRKVPKQLWVCLVSGIVWGIIVHLYMLTNKFPNWDDINNLGGYGSGAGWGRWLLQYTRPLSGWWSIPAFNGVVAIILLSLSACFVMAALDLKSMTSAVLLPGMMVSFPAVASAMTFMFTVNTYAIGILMCCAGAWLLRKYKYGFLPAIPLFLCTLGTYQSYICLAAGILVFGLVLDLLRGREIKEVVQQGIKAAAALGIGLVLYVVVSKLAYPVPMTDERGLNTMGQVQLSRMPRLIMRCYKRIVEFFTYKPYSYVSAVLQVFHIAVCVLSFMLLLWNVLVRKLYKERTRLLWLVVSVLLTPLALASIYAMAPETNDASMLMLYQYFFVYGILLALAELAMETWKREERNRNGWITKLLAVSAAVLLGCVGFQNALITNEGYFRMGLAYERVTSYYTRIVGNVENMEGYAYGDDIEILGEFPAGENPLNATGLEDEKFTEMSGIAMESGMITSGVRRNFLRTYLGIDMPFLESAQEQELVKEIKESREYQEMPIYPGEGSIRRIQGCWVVKVCEEQQKSNQEKK